MGIGMQMLEGFESGNKDVGICCSGINFVQNSRETNSHSTGLFASVCQAGFRFGISTNPPTAVESVKTFSLDNSPMKFVSLPETGFRTGLFPRLSLRGDNDDDKEAADYDDSFEIEDEGLVLMPKKTTRKTKKNGPRLKLKIGNPSLRRLISGAIAGAVSRTAVAPLETIRTHLMVGLSGSSALEVFRSVVNADGWKGLYRGNLVNVIRVVPSKGIEPVWFAENKVMEMENHDFPLAVVVWFNEAEGKWLPTESRTRENLFPQSQIQSVDGRGKRRSCPPRALTLTVFSVVGVLLRTLALIVFLDVALISLLQMSS